MEINGNSVTVYHKETKTKRVFSAIQWAELGAAGQKDWTTKRPAEAGEDDEDEGEKAPATETTEQMISRLVAEGVKAGLEKVLTPTPTAMQMTGAALPVSAGTPDTLDGSNVKLTDGQTPEEVEAALRKSAGDDTKPKTGEGEGENEPDANPELTAARKRYEELYPGQEAGRKQLKTLQEAITLKEGEGK